ncbi:PREDICTED: uncharacterized protein LOC105964730 [Erythranthe guttata]|uniref:uncharacterized protein LOC105964730 n=1 Tax=Erythranthe guttata TaxID=4155 RepID=UPI00064DFE29|nr:PREDICTED: uncharacterized protein LOC105964730 [Erythranthe guttata]|eukprot:XP_012844688.1 PREDICTED: uncharacterized protein LOC105964730 [Erythranthe guttata]
MAGQYELINTLGADKQSPKIRVRVLHTWIDKRKYGDSREFIFADEQGDRVQATIKLSLCSRYEGKLVKNKSYLISDFSLINKYYNIMYKHCIGEYRINFGYNTKIREITFPNIPSDVFNFVPYPNIGDVSEDNKFLIDIIGSLISIGVLKTFTKDGEVKENVTLDLEDLCGLKLRCVLWGTMAHAILRYVKENVDGPYIVALQFAKIQYSNIGEIEVSNTLCSSRLLINDDIPELQDFRSRGCTCYDDLRKVEDHVYPTFKDACFALGLLDDDKEYIAGINEANEWASSDYVRRLFVVLLVANNMSRPEHVWECCWKEFAEDIAYRLHNIVPIQVHMCQTIL